MVNLLGNVVKTLHKAATEKIHKVNTETSLKFMQTSWEAKARSKRKKKVRSGPPFSFNKKKPRLCELAGPANHALLNAKIHALGMNDLGCQILIQWPKLRCSLGISIHP